MQGHIEKTLYSGHASYKVSFSGLLVTDKFYPTAQIKIAFGQPTKFMIIGSNGVQRLLRADSNSPDINCGSGEHWQCRFFALEIEFSSLFSFHLTFCEAQLLLALEAVA